MRGDLADMGIFDGQMSVYLLYKLREYASLGFSGFEGRHYSLFENLEDDMGGAAGLQTLVTALAFKYLAEGELSHARIPDDPSVESERRQIFFGAAIGIPTFYVWKNSGNLFLKKILLRTRDVRQSRRYPGYVRVRNREYCRALVRILLEDGAEIIEAQNLGGTMEELIMRLENPERHSAAGKLTRGILDTVNARSPMALSAREFNQGAEKYYREGLRQRHMVETFGFLEEECIKADLAGAKMDEGTGEALQSILEGRSAVQLLKTAKREALEERATATTLGKMIALLLVIIHRDTVEAGKAVDSGKLNSGQ